jgi:hypothetical protein
VNAEILRNTWIRLPDEPGHPLSQWRRLDVVESRTDNPVPGPCGLFWDVLLRFTDCSSYLWRSQWMGQFDTSESEFRPDAEVLP